MTRNTDSKMEDLSIEVLERQGWRYPYGPDTAPDCEKQGGSNL